MVHHTHQQSFAKVSESGLKLLTTQMVNSSRFALTVLVQVLKLL